MGTNYSTMQITLAVNDALQFAKIMVDAGVKFALVGSFEPMQPMATEQAPLTSVKEEEVRATPKSRKAPNKAKRKSTTRVPAWKPGDPRSGPGWSKFMTGRPKKTKSQKPAAKAAAKK